MNKITSITDFLFQLDQLKLINRKTYINGGSRLENSAEHSWHLAMACWIVCEHLEEEYDLLKLLQLSLIHDLGEIEAGDTFLYSQHRTEAHIKERQGVEKIAQEPGNSITTLVSLWDEQELGTSKEAKLLKIIDRILPFLHNIKSEGKAWQAHDIQQSQVLNMHAFIQEENAGIYQWIESEVTQAVAKGWLGPN